MKKIDKILILYIIVITALYHFFKLNFFKENEVIISFIRDFSILFIAIIMLIRNREKIRMSKISWLLSILLFIQILIGLINGESILKSMYDIRYFIIWPSIIFISYNIVNSKEQYYMILRVMKNIAIAIGILGIYFKITNNLDFLVVRFGEYGVKSILPTHIEYGLLMFLGCAISIYLQQEKTYKKNIYITVIEFIIFTIGVYFSFSRLSYLAYSTFIVIFFNFKIIKNKILRIIFLLLELSTIIIVIPNLINEIDNVNLFSTASLLDRIYNIWLNLNVTNKLIGNGFGSIGVNNSVLNSQFDLMLTDNLFVRIYYTLGFLGLATIVLGFILMILKSNKNLFLIALVISLALAALFGDIFTMIPVIPYLYIIFGAILKLTTIKEKIN
ncbi:MAG: hypothetical protein E6248_14745 [Clostridium sp.]|uniref:hypothetical protein n=1 Tax=Clostridium sp. TaxID=1506 RepID=UPI00291159BB|nr:hypothetical protein [Clostridium sp.]MDU5111698.1 hypothetical protein [Clostridium sp.]